MNKQQTERALDLFERLVVALERLANRLPPNYGPSVELERPAPRTAAQRPASKEIPPDPDPHTAPPCPYCTGSMTLRHRRADGWPFWGCLGYPDCRGIVNIGPHPWEEDDGQDINDFGDDDIPF